MRHQAEALLALGSVGITLLEHQATYFLGPDSLQLASMPWKAVPSWGPHFGTLAYSRALFAEDGVRYFDNSEAEDCALCM